MQIRLDFSHRKERHEVHYHIRASPNFLRGSNSGFSFKSALGICRDIYRPCSALSALPIYKAVLNFSTVNESTFNPDDDGFTDALI